VPVYDDRYLDPERFFEFRRDGSVRREGADWVVQGDAYPPGNLLLFHPELRDDYLDRRHRRVPGLIEVNDARLELEFVLESVESASKLRFQLTEEGDLFETELALRPGAPATLRLLRMNRQLLRASGEPSAEHPERELARTELALALESGRAYDLEFSNVDNHLRVRSRALAFDLAHSYDENAPLHDASEAWQGSDVPQNLGSRVRFGIEGGRARFRAVRILRDLYYTEDGYLGVRQHAPDRSAPSDGARPHSDAVSLGPDDYFLLGDNSSASTDSRHFGPVKRSQMLGRPLAVVFPELRWLQATEVP
jgi:hypothetical protein